VTWSALIASVARTLGPELADQVDAIAREGFAGDQLYVPSKRRVDPEAAAQAVVEAPSVDAAARRLGVHRTTVYRRLRQWRRIR
jgi:transcriptional regulator of acetoin/glycerol metabolism